MVPGMRVGQLAIGGDVWAVRGGRMLSWAVVEQCCHARPMLPDVTQHAVADKVPSSSSSSRLASTAALEFGFAAACTLYVCVTSGAGLVDWQKMACVNIESWLPPDRPTCAHCSPVRLIALTLQTPCFLVSRTSKSSSRVIMSVEIFVSLCDAKPLLLALMNFFYEKFTDWNPLKFN